MPERVWKKGSPPTAGGNGNWCRSVESSEEEVPQNTGLELTYGPGIPLLSRCLGEKTPLYSKRSMHVKVHHSTIYNR